MSTCSQCMNYDAEDQWCELFDSEMSPDAFECAEFYPLSAIVTIRMPPEDDNSG